MKWSINTTLPHVNIVVVLRVSKVYHLFPDLVDGLSVALHVCEVIVGWVLQIVVNHPKAGVEDQETVCVQGKGISKWAQLGPRGKPAKEIKAFIKLKGGEDNLLVEGWGQARAEDFKRGGSRF